jgi:dGTPase
MMRPFDRFFETNGDFRSPYDRDRDRIIHSHSFRNLEYKTQVFLNSDGDYFRTRLTHSLEASQISRTIAKNLGLNESLSEAIALSHDIGHTPFGHIGGDTLDECLKEAGSANGFEHNYQSFRVLTKLERRYKGFDGLNLTFATLEGVLKHSAPYKKSFLPSSFDEIFRLDFHPSFEAIVVDNSDSIAYISADIDDALRYSLVCISDLEESTLVRRIVKRIEKDEKIEKDEPLFRHRLTTHIITELIADIIETSSKNRAVFDSVDAPACGLFAMSEMPLIRFSEEMWSEIKELKALLLKKVYRHESITRKMYLAKQCIKALFRAFTDEPNMLPPEFRAQIGASSKNRVVADFISSQSDRSAMELYRGLH